jgi:hypothetical protein
MQNSTAVSKEKAKMSKWQIIHTFIKKNQYFPKTLDGTPRITLYNALQTSIYSLLSYISHITDTANIWCLP